MPEILTESFCERCGTRYTFESVAPRKTRKLGQFKTLSKGVKNWVMSDDSSLDEAMAAARSDEDRALTAHQLDAFHSTFNFCMNCRQYTCANCWNQAEGRCLSCAPNLGDELVSAAFPDAAPFEPARLDVGAWPQADLIGAATDGAELGLAGLPTNGMEERAGDDSNGFHARDNATTEPESSALESDLIGEAGAVGDELPDFDAVARLAFLSGETPADDNAATEVAAGVGADLDAEPEAESIAEPLAAERDELALETQPADDVAVAAADVEAAVDDVEAPVDDMEAPVDDRAAELAARTADLLGRFRPGQSIDAELEAYEAALAAESDRVAAVAAEHGVAATDAVGAEHETLVADAEDLVPTSDVAAELPIAVEEPAVLATTADVELDELAAPATEVEAEPEAVAAADAAEIEPVAASTSEPEPELAAATQETLEAAEPAAPGEDRIEQPTWRIFAPEPSGPAGDGPTPAPANPDQIPVQATSEPQWPARPEFIESPSMALLADRARASSEAIWAASAREVAGPPRSTGPTMPPAPPGIQPCSNCGLSLSATARFCRRCGTRQG